MNDHGKAEKCTRKQGRRKDTDGRKNGEENPDESCSSPNGS